MKPIIIGIGGAQSGAGKTAYASLLLQRLKGWGAIKYTKTALYCSITDDPAILAEEGKDTRRFMDAGAEKVLWVQSPVSEASEILPIAVERFSGLKGIIVEGNTAIEFLKPDIIIFIFGTGSGNIKDSAGAVLGTAHIVIYDGRQEMRLPENVKLFGKSPDEKKEFAAYVAGIVETREKIKAALSRESKNGMITCAFARKIAEDLDIQYKEVGSVADELGVRIIECELGCF